MKPWCCYDERKAHSEENTISRFNIFQGPNLPHIELSLHYMHCACPHKNKPNHLLRRANFLGKKSENPPRVVHLKILSPSKVNSRWSLNCRISSVSLHVFPTKRFFFSFLFPFAFSFCFFYSLWDYRDILCILPRCSQNGYFWMKKEWWRTESKFLQVCRIPTEEFQDNLTSNIRFVVVGCLTSEKWMISWTDANVTYLLSTMTVSQIVMSFILMLLAKARCCKAQPARDISLLITKLVRGYTQVCTIIPDFTSQSSW